MEDVNELIFVRLFKAACEKCFNHLLTEALSENDSKLLSTKIHEQTGLVIGVKSIRNYSLYIFNRNARKENPSIATLDTFARYVLNAPYTDEIQRKSNESHHPYWYQYRTLHPRASLSPRKLLGRKTLLATIGIAVATVAFLSILVTRWLQNDPAENFTDNFEAVEINSLKNHGWSVRSMDPEWWNKRNAKPGHLSLFTLYGDNWTDDGGPRQIKNLLTRRISGECFMTEIHLSEFFPVRNWQQAGILLAEDSTFTGKLIRLSISYNDFFGGYEKSPEIIIQGISSVESGDKSKPEEFAHFTLFSLDKGQEVLVANNLKKSALKIEKNDDRFRFLFAAGKKDFFAFKEITNGSFDFHPNYIGLFAIQGIVEKETPISADFDSFVFMQTLCGD